MILLISKIKVYVKLSSLILPRAVCLRKLIVSVMYLRLDPVVFCGIDKK